jgi:hypothetical protein
MKENRSQYKRRITGRYKTIHINKITLKISMGTLLASIVCIPLDIKITLNYQQRLICNGLKITTDNSFKPLQMIFSVVVVHVCERLYLYLYFKTYIYPNH